jgi:predicted esterase
MELDCVIVPPSKPHTFTVIFLHGRGDTARSFATSLRNWIGSSSEFQSLFDALPEAKWVIPSSGMRPAVTFGGRLTPQWFDRFSSQDFHLKPEINIPGLRESVTAVLRLIRKEAAALNGRWDRIVLAGISQGGAVATHTLLNIGLWEFDPAPDAKLRLGAVVEVASAMAFPDLSLQDTRAVLGLPDSPSASEDDIVRNTPVLLQHNLNDHLVSLAEGRRLKDNLTRFGAAVESREYPDGGHWFCSPEGLDDCVEFLKRHLS